MSELVSIIWTVLGIIFIIAEIFTTGFVLLWFGVGALVAAFAAMLGFGYPFQFLVFFLVSIALTVLSRTIFNKYFAHHSDAALKSGAESLPGQIGIVVEPSVGALKEAAVKVYGSTWKAYPVEGEDALKLGERVAVESVRGSSVYVRRTETLPGGWRSAIPAADEQ